MSGVASLIGSGIEYVYYLCVIAYVLASFGVYPKFLLPSPPNVDDGESMLKQGLGVLAEVVKVVKADPNKKE